MLNKVTVDLEKRSYEILIGNGAINELEIFLANKKYSKIIILTDENVAKFHLDKLNEVLQKTPLQFESIIISAGEKSKSFASLEQTCEEILSKKIDRKSLILAFGGGVIGDLSGFLASILLRGIDFVQIPTTLLSMVDSSVGGKTAINSKHGKNLIGSFYQPKLVICDLQFLSTLDEREFRAGYAEVVKYGIIEDAEFFEYLEENLENIFAKDFEVIAQIVAKSCQIKAQIVNEDETEQGKRALLNFGHTFGHVFETETNYSDELNHGEAVAIGMILAAKMSKKLGLVEDFVVTKILNHLQKTGLPTSPRQIRQNWEMANLVNHLYKDKKVENGNLTFVLLEKIGKAFVKKEISVNDFEKIVAAEL